MSGVQSEEIRKEVEKLLADVKKTHDTLLSDWQTYKDETLPAFIKEQAKGSVDPLLQEKVDNTIKGVLTAQEAMNARVDQMEVALKRAPLGGDDPEASRAEFKNAKAFFTQIAIRKGRLEGGRQLADEDVDVEAYRAYKHAHNRFLRKDELHMEPDELKSLSVGTDSDGGYVVMPERSDRIVTRIFESSPIRQVAAVETISTDSLELLVDKDQAAFGWVAEKETRPETDTPKLAKQVIPVHEMYANPAATQKLLDDSSVDIESWLDGKVSNRFARAENSAFVNGDGVGKPRGMLTYPAGTSWQQIQQVNSGVNGGINKDGVIDVFMAQKEFYMARSSWLMNRGLVAEVMKIASTTDVLLWMPSLRDGLPSTLIGRPLRFAQDFPAPATGTLSGAIGDFNEGYTIVDRMGIRVLRDPYTAKPFVLFYTTKRTGGDVTNFEAIKLIKLSAA